MTKEAVQEMHENIGKLKAGEEFETLNDEIEGGEVVEDGDELETPEYSDIQLTAIKRGWNPDPESVPEGKEWVDAGEFMRNEKFFNEIRKLKRENKQTKQALDDLKEHHKKVQEIEREKLLSQLKRQKKAAMEDADHDEVIKIDEQIAEVNKQTEAAKTEIDETVDNEAQAIYEEAFTEWLEVNSWYSTNEQMRTVADAMGRDYVTSHQGQNLSPDQIFGHVEKQIKAIFPQEFNGKKNKPTATRRAPAVEGAQGGARRQTSGKPKFTAKDLNDDQRRVMQRLIRVKAIDSEQQYIDELVKIGELG